MASNRHKPGGDADTDLKTSLMSGAKHRDRLDQRQGAAHRSLGIILMRLRVTKVTKHAVPHVLGDEATGLGDLLSAAAMIGADDLTHVFGVEPS